MITALEGFIEERHWRERIAEVERGDYIAARESNRILSEALNAKGKALLPSLKLIAGLMPKHERQVTENSEAKDETHAQEKTSKCKV